MAAIKVNPGVVNFGHLSKLKVQVPTIIFVVDIEMDLRDLLFRGTVPPYNMNFSITHYLVELLLRITVIRRSPGKL